MAGELFSRRGKLTTTIFEMDVVSNYLLNMFLRTHN